jgi:hypothetical protein
MMIGTLLVAIDGWGSDVYLESSSFSWLYNCVPSYRCYSAGTTKPNPFLLATATDKTNNPTYCFAYTNRRSARNVLC